MMRAGAMIAAGMAKERMRVAVVGLSGGVSVRILREAVARGHDVTTTVQSAEPPPAAQDRAPYRLTSADRGLVGLLARHDAVVSGVPAPADQAVLLHAVLSSGVRRYVIIGGAGSLEGQLEAHARHDPSIRFFEEALASREFVRILRDVRGLQWVFFSPSAVIARHEIELEWTCVRQFDIAEPVASTRNARGSEPRRPVTFSRILPVSYHRTVLDELERPW